jgi:hypothetical protein
MAHVRVKRPLEIRWFWTITALAHPRSVDNRGS